MRALAALAIGLGLVAGATHAQAQQVWQGTAFITGFTSTTAQAVCEAGNTAAIGNDFVVVYRPIILGSPNNGSGNDEGLSFFGGRNGLHYFTADNTRFPSATKAYLISLGSHANSQSAANTAAAPTIPVSVKITSPTTAITLTTPAITLKGSLDNWFNVAGCNVNFTAALDLRVD